MYPSWYTHVESREWSNKKTVLDDFVTTYSNHGMISHSLLKEIIINFFIVINITYNYTE